MINYIKGTITRKSSNYLWIENKGMGYFVNTSSITLSKIQTGEEACIYTYMHVREDILALYGFTSEAELEMFKKLISVNKVGPKAALAILSLYEVDTLRVHILSNNDKAISKASGVGAKTATKIVLDLKDKVGSIEDISNATDIQMNVNDGAVEITSGLDDVFNVLLDFGFSRQEIKNALKNVDLDGKNESAIIKEALRNLNG